MASDSSQRTADISEVASPELQIVPKPANEEVATEEKPPEDVDLQQSQEAAPSSLRGRARAYDAVQRHAESADTSQRSLWFPKQKYALPASKA